MKYPVALAATTSEDSRERRAIGNWSRTTGRVSHAVSTNAGVNCTLMLRKTREKV